MVSEGGVMNWTPGPARCRSDEYEAEIAFTDMPLSYPLHGRIRQKGKEWETANWTSEGRYFHTQKDKRDLMPPTITREALAKEVYEAWKNVPIGGDAWLAVVAHVIEAVKSGRVE